MPPRSPGSTLSGRCSFEKSPFSASEVVVVVAVVDADRALPDGLAGLRVDRDEDAGLATVDHDLLAVRGGEHGGVLHVPVVDVVTRQLVVPDVLARLRVELDDRVGVEIRPRPARAPRELRRSGERRRIRDPDVQVALAVKGRWIPHPAAGVDVLVRRGPEVRGHLIELPLGRPRLGVHRPENPLAVAAIEHLRVTGHGRHIDGAVVVTGRHVDALAAVADQRLRPQLLPVRGLKCERCAVRRAVERSVVERHPVRAFARRVVLVRPEHLAALEVDGLDVGLEVLRVEHAVRGHRCGRVCAEGAVGGDRHRPRHSEPRDVGCVDRAADIP